MKQWQIFMLIQVHTQAGSLGGSDRDPNTYYAIRESGVEQVDVEAVTHRAGNAGSRQLRF